MIPADVGLDQVDVWFQDEARVGQQGTLTRVWARKGTRPRVVRQRQYESAYLFGAVCPNRDEAVGLILPSVNLKAMQLHLQALSAEVPVGRHAVVVLDKAPWHTSQKLKGFANLSLLPLPAASPELNPTEQVWQCLRDRDLANRCFEDYDQIVEACTEAWNKFIRTVGAVKRLCSRQWATVIT